MMINKDYGRMHPWEAYFKELPVEYEQSIEEGKDISQYKALFDAAAAMPDSRAKEEIADALFRLVMDAPQRADYPYVEPSDLDSIEKESDGARKTPVPDEDTLRDRIVGAWYGRICGCLLGKPIEGIKTDELIPFLKSTGNYPMHRYIVHSEAVAHGDMIRFPIAARAYGDGVIDGMPVDDDTNYIVLAEKVVADYGRDFKPEDMMKIWLDLQCKDAYCTAERVAYRNFVDGFVPPESAIYKNPYREWIGAQIRGDYFGWIAPGDPVAAARMAFSDASISHIKNGIYGEMWVSAMLAVAASGGEVEDVIRAGLAAIPKKSRLHEAVTRVINAWKSGVSPDDFFSDLHKRWNEYDSHHWCHTISNAEIVSAALLWGRRDYGKTICLAAQQGFDTDCNAATAGSVLGMLIGIRAIPAEWKDKIGGMLNTSISGFFRVKVDEMAEETVRLALGKDRI